MCYLVLLALLPLAVRDSLTRGKGAQRANDLGQLVERVRSTWVGLLEEWHLYTRSSAESDGRNMTVLRGRTPQGWACVPRALRRCHMRSLGNMPLCSHIGSFLGPRIA